MTNSYEIRYLPTFYDDLVAKIRYIRDELQNPTAADKLLEDVHEAILQRSEGPIVYERYESKKERRYPYYRIYVRNFIVYYVVIPGEHPIMEVRRFLYRGQNRTIFV